MIELPRVRMLAKGFNGKTVVADGRQLDSAPGVLHDVTPEAVPALEAEGWVTVGRSGSTKARPTINLAVRDLFFDTTLACLLIWDGSDWRKSTRTKGTAN